MLRRRPQPPPGRPSGRAGLGRVDALRVASAGLAEARGARPIILTPLQVWRRRGAPVTGADLKLEIRGVRNRNIEIKFSKRAIASGLVVSHGICMAA